MSALTSLPWQAITVRMNDAGALLFDYRPMHPPGERRTYARDDVLLLKDRSDDGLLGVSRLQRAAGAMGYAIQIQATSQKFSQNMARPSGLLTTDQHMSDDNRQRMKEEWDRAYRAAELGGTAVLSGGLHWGAISLMSGADAQIIESRQWSVGDVARIFGLSPWLLGDSTRMTFASAREAMRSFAMLTLAPWARRVEKAFQATVLSNEYRLHFDVEALAKSDTDSLYTALLKGRQGGWLSPNDAREETGWPRSDDPNADKLDPPVAGGRAASDQPSGEEPKPPAGDEGEGKGARSPTIVPFGGGR